jgi:hypothetical protein
MTDSDRRRFTEPTALPAAPPDPEIPLGDPHWMEKHCAKYGIELNGQMLDPADWGVTPTEQHPGSTAP